jgi:2-polyprenyl-6-methoxyphenol hydroxylase-like FAD-dependent oxidoreductase/predicted DsbA family dithiol-disulfide isomerase
MKNTNQSSPKIVVIGGGIAGLAFAIHMQQKGFSVVLNERGDQIPEGTNAFLMHDEGMQALRALLGHEATLPGHAIHTISMRDQSGRVINETTTNPWQCIRRKSLVQFLMNHVSEAMIQYNRTFSHFLYEGDVAVAAVFQNGEVEFGDLFVGADGCHSAVRKALFGETAFTETAVLEILGTVEDPALISRKQGLFTKYQHTEKGLSFGCIPVSDTEAVWFQQLDARLLPHALNTPQALETFTKEMLSEFPEEVQSILNKTDFTKAYLWKTRDFDPLDRFHQSNVVLIGDAAHVALPFTSAGTTNALIDAHTLSVCLEREESLDAAFNAFYQSRINEVSEHVQFGRNMKEQFLNPARRTETIAIPLITENEKNKNTKPVLPELLYFTDPICSTCWVMQTSLNTLFDQLAEHVTLRYVMGGLLPHWQGFNRGGIRTPQDVYHHWIAVSKTTGISINPAVWKNDPIQSSLPASIAFKAAQLQGEKEASIFLNGLHRRVFIEGKNIERSAHLLEAAEEARLHIPQFMHDLSRDVVWLLQHDLATTHRYRIQSLPGFVLKIGQLHHQLFPVDQPVEKLLTQIQSLLDGSISCTDRQPDRKLLFAEAMAA